MSKRYLAGRHGNRPLQKLNKPLHVVILNGSEESQAFINDKHSVGVRFIDHAKYQ